MNNDTCVTSWQQRADLDVPVMDGEPEEDEDEAHDEAGHAQQDAALQPVQVDHAGAGVSARVAPGGTRQALEGDVVVVVQVLEKDTHTHTHTHTIIIICMYFKGVAELIINVW